MERLFTKDQMWSFAIHCIKEDKKYKPSPTGGNIPTFLQAVHESPMFRNGIFEPWKEENDFKVVNGNIKLQEGVDYDIVDGSTLRFRKPIQ